MGTKNNPAPNNCYENAFPDEPMFTLLARDPSAPDLIVRWAAIRNEQIALGKRPLTDAVLVQEAIQCADSMRSWRKKNGFNP